MKWSSEVVKRADEGHFVAVKMARGGRKMPPPVVEIPPVEAEKKVLTWNLVKSIMKAYGLKMTGQEDEQEKYFGFHVSWREDEAFLRDRFVGGVKVWWRAHIDGPFIYPGKMKRVTTDEAILHCWPQTDACTLLQNFRSLGIRHVDVVHFFESSSTSPEAPLPYNSELVTDYTNIIETNFEEVRESLIAHLHSVIFHLEESWSAEKCCYCASLVKSTCKDCGVVVCNNKPECLHDHWKEIADDEENYPRYHAHDDFARQLFAQAYIKAKNADVHIETNNKHA